MSMKRNQSILSRCWRAERGGFGVGNPGAPRIQQVWLRESLVVVAGLICTLTIAAGAADVPGTNRTPAATEPGSEKVLFTQNFEGLADATVPGDFLVLEGGFSVKGEGTNKVLELPGAPLDTFGVLFGPSESQNVILSLRAHGQRRGRLFPAFGAGLNGVSGYKLQVTPAKRALELFRTDTLRTNIVFQWDSERWTWLKLRTIPVPEGLRVEAKAWSDGTPEPDWMIRWIDPEPAPAGRAALWGAPFSGAAIRYDDLKVSAVPRPSSPR
jgi:hypothetical protein